MMRIPRTREEFERMDFCSQSEVKGRLVQDNMTAMCKAAKPGMITTFSRFLYREEMAVLQLSKDRKGPESIAMDLLLIIMDSSRKNPSWWETLEEVLLDNDSSDLCDAMNPWEKRNTNGEATPERRGGDNGRGGGGRTAVFEDGRNAELKAGNQEAAQESMSLETDCPHPSQPSCARQEAPEGLQSSQQQEIESQRTVASQQPGTEAQQFPFGVAPPVPVINIYCDYVKNMMLTQDSTGNEDLRRPPSGDEVEPELSMPVPEDSSAAESGNTEASADSHRSGIGEYQEEAQEEILYSYRPYPLDSSAHETILKEIDSADSGYNEVEGEEHPFAAGQQDISDTDLRGNGVSVTDRACHFGNNDTMQSPSAHLMTPEDPQSPLSPPQPQQSGPMAVLSTAWVLVRDIVLGLE